MMHSCPGFLSQVSDVQRFINTCLVEPGCFEASGSFDDIVLISGCQGSAGIWGYGCGSATVVDRSEAGSVRIQTMQAVINYT